MLGVVDAANANAGGQDVNFVERARVLGKPPEGRERLVEELEQQGPVDAVVSDENDGIVGMPIEGETQAVG
jgi:hypothetical protein